VAIFELAIELEEAFELRILMKILMILKRLEMSSTILIAGSAKGEMKCRS
jgi:hypothetical protein